MKKLRDLKDLTICTARTAGAGTGLPRLTGTPEAHRNTGGGRTPEAAATPGVNPNEGSVASSQEGESGRRKRSVVLSPFARDFGIVNDPDEVRPSGIIRVVIFDA